MTNEKKEINREAEFAKLPASPFEVSPAKGRLFLLLLIGVAIAVAVGFGLHFFAEKYVLKYSFYKWKKIIKIAIKIVSIAVSALLSAQFIRIYLRNTATKYILSELYIKEIRGFPLIPNKESCDMTKVVDAKVGFSGFYFVKIFTTDTTTPIIQINNLTESQADDVFNFVNFHGVNNQTEYRLRKDAQQAHDKKRG